MAVCTLEVLAHIQFNFLKSKSFQSHSGAYVDCLLYCPSSLGVRAQRVDYFIYRSSINPPVFSLASPSGPPTLIQELLWNSSWHWLPLPCNPLMVLFQAPASSLSAILWCASFPILSSKDCWNSLCSSISLLLEMYFPFLFLYNLIESQKIVKRNICIWCTILSYKKPYVF